MTAPSTTASANPVLYPVGTAITGATVKAAGVM